MATTTNYSWTTPDDTALVKDGAAAIRSLGTAIDTTVFTNAGNAIAKTIVDAKGDIIAATAADTVNRLAVGANDTVLTADSSTATGLKWAAPASGGMTLISTTTLTGASITLSSIPSTYNDLRLVIRDFLPATDAAELKCRVNNVSTSDTYRSLVSASADGPINYNGSSWALTANGGQDNATANGKIVITIYDYANADTMTVAKVDGVITDSTTPASNFWFYNNTCFFRNTVAVSSLVLFPSSGNFTSGTVLLYGVK
jgi:hypothetical protein